MATRSMDKRTGCEGSRAVIQETQPFLVQLLQLARSLHVIRRRVE